jgi:hypothetical protein
MTLFTVGDVDNHHRGDLECPECSENYPEGCQCGGLMHASETNQEDADGNLVVATLCDRCGRSEDDLDAV